MIDSSAVNIRQVLFGPYYAAHMFTTECDYQLRLAYDSHAIKEADHRSERLVRWIASYIPPLGMYAPWV